MGPPRNGAHALRAMPQACCQCVYATSPVGACVRVARAIDRRSLFFTTDAGKRRRHADDDNGDADAVDGDGNGGGGGDGGDGGDGGVGGTRRGRRASRCVVCARHVTSSPHTCNTGPFFSLESETRVAEFLAALVSQPTDADLQRLVDELHAIEGDERILLRHMRCKLDDYNAVQYDEVLKTATPAHLSLPAMSFRFMEIERVEAVESDENGVRASVLRDTFNKRRRELGLVEVTLTQLSTLKMHGRAARRARPASGPFIWPTAWALVTEFRFALDVEKASVAAIVRESEDARRVTAFVTNVLSRDDAFFDSVANEFLLLAQSWRAAACAASSVPSKQRLAFQASFASCLLWNKDAPLLRRLDKDAAFKTGMWQRAVQVGPRCVPSVGERRR